ncbi:MAG: hypothetical protein ABIN95_13310 [Mucilaginibacter sp.]
MDEGLKNKAYLEGSRLKKAGYDNEIIFARLEKQGIPEELAKQVIKNLTIQRKAEIFEQQKPFYNIAILRIGIGVFLAIASAILIPGHIYIPVGLILGGVILALMAKSKMKG